MSVHISVRRATFIEESIREQVFFYSLSGPLERQIIMNLLWLESSIPVSTMSSWVVDAKTKFVLVQVISS